MLLGNNLFNKDVVETHALSDRYGVIGLRYKDVLSYLPFWMVSASEKEACE